MDHAHSAAGAAAPSEPGAVALDRCEVDPGRAPAASLLARERLEHVDAGDHADQAPVLDDGQPVVLGARDQRAASSTLALGSIVTGVLVIRSRASAAVALRRRSSKCPSDSRKTRPPNSSK
jgi:hypothetical protein